MSDFSDRPFVAGSLFGLRAFRIDSLGRLTGVVHKDVWRPGENEAVCRKSSAGAYAFGGMLTPQQIIWGTTTGTVTFGPSTTDEPRHAPRGKKGKKKWIPPTETAAEKVARVALSDAPAKREHGLAGVDCACGFYAYFDGANDYLTSRTAPTPSGFYITYGDDDTAPRIGAIVEGWGVCTVGSRGFRASKARIVALIDPDGDNARTIIAFEKVRRAYPDVPVFESERDAIRAFPLSEPLSALPSDDDFWTRSA
jgi:hypothetical protein